MNWNDYKVPDSNEMDYISQMTFDMSGLPALKMEAVFSSERLVPTHKSTRQDQNWHLHRHENFKYLQKDFIQWHQPTKIRHKPPEYKSLETCRYNDLLCGSTWLDCPAVTATWLLSVPQCFLNGPLDGRCVASALKYGGRNETALCSK